MSENDEPYDFTGEELGPLEAEPGGPLGPETGSGFAVVRAPSRETTRRWLAMWLVFLFAAVILLSLCAVLFASVSAGTAKSILEVQLPPIVALTGSALGFYFGVERSGSS